MTFDDRRSRLRSGLIHTLLVCMCAATLDSQAQDTGRPTFRAGVEMVVVSATVRDSRDRLVTTLEREDFRLSVDGRPVSVEVFTKERRSLMLGILISTRPEQNVPRLREVGRALVEGLEPTEFATVGTYGVEIAISPFATSDRAVLHRVLNEEIWPMGFVAPVSTAVAAMIEAMPKDRGKPVIVVAGSDYAQSCFYRPCLGEGEARELAVREGVVIYGIVNRTKAPPTQIGASPVAKLSASTGGGYVVLTAKDDLGALMAQVTEELRHEYLLGFTPAVADEREHTVKVDVTRPGHRAIAHVTRKAARQ
jgi:Ca-activated chloride channel family protein